MTTTELFTIGTIAVVITVDIWLAVTGRETVSQLTWRTSKRWPLIPFAAGVLAGHLFWGQ